MQNHNLRATPLTPPLRHQHHYLNLSHNTTTTTVNNLTASIASIIGYSDNDLGLRLDSIFKAELKGERFDPLGQMEGNSSDYNGTDLDHVNKSDPNMTCFTSQYHRSIYPLALPIMIFFCILSILVNLLIVVSARWCRKPMSPTLYFSISLALADAFASLLLATGLIINTLLPCVYDIRLTNQCFPLTIEAIRLGGILITVKHLLALGMNHWIGIVRPLHYAATMTRRTAWFIILFSWICPIFLLLIFFSSHPGQGFLNDNCKKNDFLNQKTFRILFSSLFFGPLIIMSIVYLHIFFIVRNHHLHRLQYQRNNEEESCHQFRRNIKAVVTTILILGTYILGWIPGILWFIIVCEDCAISLKAVPQHVAVPVSIMNNSLIILKAFVNPIIYAARMSDIKSALRKMQYDIMSRICPRCVPDLPPPSDGLERASLCESRSLRMSSRGSNNFPSRRQGTVNSINNTNNSNAASLNHHHHHHSQLININSNENGNRVTFDFEMKERN